MKMRLIVVLLFICPVLVFAKIGGGDIKYKPKNAGPVVFSHEYHVNLKGQKCTNCHFHPFQTAAKSYKMNMQALTKGDFCGKCHNGKEAFDLKSQENCSKCHQK